MLATLAVAMRPTGAPRWEAPGVMAQLAKVAHMQLADVVCAVARAAADRTLQTPGPIANTQSPCWRERPAEKTAPRNLRPSESCWNGDHRLSFQPPCCEKPERRPERGGDPSHPDSIRARMGWSRRDEGDEG